MTTQATTTQAQATIELTQTLLNTLQQNKNDFAKTKDAVMGFITAMDGMTGGPIVLGDGDLAQLYAGFLKRRGKPFQIGVILLQAEWDIRDAILRTYRSARTGPPATTTAKAKRDSRKRSRAAAGK